MMHAAQQLENAKSTSNHAMANINPDVDNDMVPSNSANRESVILRDMIPPKWSITGPSKSLPKAIAMVEAAPFEEQHHRDGVTF